MSQDPIGIKIDFDPTKQRMSGFATHGMTPFDVPFISLIGYNLWQGGCRNGLILPKSIKHVISLYPWERYKIKHELDTFVEVRMYDSVDQMFEQVELLAQWVNMCRATGPTLVHCQAGLNRSSLIATRAMMLAGKTADDAINTLRARRSPACLCNPAFEEYLRSIK